MKQHDAAGRPRCAQASTVAPNSGPADRMAQSLIDSGLDADLRSEIVDRCHQIGSHKVVILAIDGAGQRRERAAKALAIGDRIVHRLVERA